MIRILVVDDQKSVRERLIATLQAEKDFQIVGTANDGYTAIEQVEVHKPDVVLLDMQMPNLDGVSATKIICQRFIGIKILMYSVHDNEDYISRALLSGAVGYLVKGSPDEELNEAIRFIYRGYTQIRPGWFDNLTVLEPNYAEDLEEEESPEESPVATNGTNGTNGTNSTKVALSGTRGQLALQGQYEPQFFFGSFNEDGKGGNWKNYIIPWLIANLVVWSAGLLYLRLSKPTYISNWAVSLSAQNTTTNINLPDIGEATSRTESAFNQESSDPRENYKFIAETDEVIAKAAKKLNLTPEEFGKPTIKIVDNTTLMRFQIQGDTPEQAQKKALAMQKVFLQELKDKRNEEMTQQNGNLMSTLDNAQQKLQLARQKLSEYQGTSGLSSKEQLQELSTNVETLRRQQAEQSGQLQKANGRYERLLQDLGLNSTQASEAFILQSDRRFQKYLSEYSRLSGEAIALNARYFPSHPEVVEKQAEVDEVKSALFAQGRQLLGKPVDDNTLRQLSLDGESAGESKRAALFQELVSLQAERQGLDAQTNELQKQLDRLENKRTNMSKSGATLENLQQNVKIAEAVFSSTLAQLDLSKSTISANYPPIVTAARPNLPAKPSSPKSILVLLGTTVCSAFLTTALLSLWWRDRTKRQFRRFEQQQSQPILPQRIDRSNSISVKK
jgi:DNA-binding NarL/FixJ family response regulator/uncharacterized protein involved in exopolysaccharide biosynthesis